MSNIVREMVKVDLHIHSAASFDKDGEKVLNNTIENLPKLYEKLELTKVNLISITDHNKFDLDLYKKIQSDIKKNDTNLKLNLPGIEFDVEIDRKRIHVVCIFSDKNHKKIEKIPTILSKYCFDFNSKNSGDFDCYKQHTFQNILAEINTDVILIAHQKSDVHAKTHSRNLSNVGTSRFNEIISVDYFDAVEFQSGRIEGMLKNYKTDNNLENLRFITGTDCHDWEVYPFQDATKNNIIDFTYMRSLCSFKGLVMALTEPSRLSTSNISIHTPHIRNIQLTIDGEEEKINLSPGINVIIGDNSIGKSLLVQKLFNKSYSVENKGLVTKHSAYLKSKKISINPILDLDNVQYIFRGQGGIRKDFQTDGDISNVTFFKDKFPKVEDEWIKLRLDEHADLVIDNIENNVKTKEAESNLNFTLNIPADISEEFYYLTTKNDLNEYDTKGYGLIENDLNIAIGALNRIMKNEVFSSKDRIEKIIEEIRELILKNNIAKENIKIQNNIINSINEEFKNFNEKYTGKQQSRENQMRNYIVQSDSFINKIEEVIKAKSSKICDPTDNFETIILPIERNPRGNYSFNTKRSKTEITKDDLKIILLGPLTSGVTYESLISRFDFDMLKDNTNKTLASKHIQKQHDNSELYKAMVKDYYETHYLSLDRYISNLSDDLSTGNSPGKNALIYLDVLSQDDTHQVVIIDQPGDDVSQNRVANELLSIFKKMSDNNKQILLVTHKPELVVNLDVDNVIIIKEGLNGKIEIFNGALEFEDENINILSEVAETLDGGVDTIRRRWKRYEKN